MSSIRDFHDVGKAEIRIDAFAINGKKATSSFRV